MRKLLESCIRSGTVLALVICACGPSAPTEPVPVRHVQGTMHGFLELRSPEKRVLASGEFIQTVHGDDVTAETIFRFKDGSIDDETTVFSQHRIFALISDRHIQKGPFFPHPTDTLIDAGKSRITVRSTGKDGKQDVKTDHFDLPPDLANGMLSLILENIAPGAGETTVSMVVFTPSPRLVKLVISPLGEAPFSIAGASRPGSKFQVHIDIGGLTGIVAHLLGKQPPNLYFWIYGGPAPTFLKEQGQTYANGPILSIDLVGPNWPE